MTRVLHLAWQYLRWHRWKTLILVTAVSLVLYLPLALQLLIEQTARDLTARADATPLVLGSRGSPLELVLNALYFSAERPPAFDFEAVETLAGSGLVDPVPLHVRHSSQGVPIVGTTLDYFDYRGLAIARGRQLAMLGEAVLGSEAAERLGVTVGDSVISSPESVFDIAGVYPLKMPVVGILEPALTPDDGAVFVDLKTAWVIDGIGHGHQELTRPESAGAVLKTEGDRIVANASLVQYNEITPENMDSFHFSGRSLTGVLPLPRSDKSRVLLLGRYQSDAGLLLLEPRAVIDQLLDTLFAVQGYILVAMTLVGTATAAVAILVLLLSWRARRGEQETLFRLGGSKTAILALMLSESVIVLFAAALLAGLLLAVTQLYGGPLIRAVLL